MFCDFIMLSVSCTSFGGMVKCDDDDNDDDIQFIKH